MLEAELRFNKKTILEIKWCSNVKILRNDLETGKIMISGLMAAVYRLTQDNLERLKVH